MNSNSEFAWQFEVSRTKLSSKFMAGRGQVLLQALNWPLQAQEFAKRKKLQEILSRGMLRVDQSPNISPLNFISKRPKNQESQDLKSPCSNLSSVHTSEPSPRQHQAQNTSSMFATATPSVETWNHKEANNQFGDAEIREDCKTMNQSSKDNSQSEWYNLQSNFMPKDFERKNAAKPLRKPDKTRNKQTETDQAASAMQNKDQYQGYGINNQNDKTGGNAWLDWENNVIIAGSVADEDLPEIAAVEDNDDINDVVVDQYINALQNNHNGTTPTDKNRKLTPQRVQQFSKLKSTSNADCTRVLPGTQPNPPKGDDRWGGSELNSNHGWGDPSNTQAKNSYDDGSSLWSSGGSQYGGVSWSNAC